MTGLDEEKIIAWQDSPLEFIFDMWGLVPQPVKADAFDLAQDAINRGAWNDFDPKWFLPFVKGKHITWQQWLIFLAVERALVKVPVESVSPGGPLNGKSFTTLGPRRISVSSGHGIGKDAALSMLILWYLFCFKDAQVPCTAPSSEQMYDILWKEIAKWMRRMPQEVSDMYDWSASYIRMKERPQTWFARAKTARKESPEALAGVHGEWVFMAVDEASGVAEEIFNTAEGALTNENILIVLISNPTRIVGYFYDSQHEKCAMCTARRGLSYGVLMWKGGEDNCEHAIVPAMEWQRMQLDSEQSPIVDRDFVERIIAKQGLDSDEYKIRVKGTFADADAVDSQGYVPLLLNSDIKEVDDKGGFKRGWARLGVDPAGDGKNKTEWVIRDRFRAKIVATEDVSDGFSIASKTIQLMELYGIPDWQVTVDAFGEGVDAVQELALSGYRVLAINTGDDCFDKADRKLYINMRAMISWSARQWIKKGGELVRDRKKRWIQATVVRYRRQLSGKLKVMDKQEMRKRGIASPDVWDALTLTFCRPDNYEQKTTDQMSDEEINNATGLYDH